MARGNSEVLMPRDKDLAPVQALAPSTIVNAAVTGSSSRSTLPTGSVLVEIGVNEDAWIEFGDNTVTAASTSSMFMPKGAVVYRVPADATDIAYIQDSTSGRISITKLV